MLPANPDPDATPVTRQPGQLKKGACAVLAVPAPVALATRERAVGATVVPLLARSASNSVRLSL
jgi:hypothetical protein